MERRQMVVPIALAMSSRPIEVKWQQLGVNSQEARGSESQVHDGGRQIQVNRCAIDKPITGLINVLLP